MKTAALEVEENSDDGPVYEVTDHMNQEKMAAMKTAALDVKENSADGPVYEVTDHMNPYAELSLP